MKDKIDKSDNNNNNNNTTNFSDNIYDDTEEVCEILEVNDIKTISKLISESECDIKNFNQNDNDIIIIKEESCYLLNESNQKEISEFNKNINENNIENQDQKLGNKRKKEEDETKKEIYKKNHTKYNKDNITCKIKRNLFSLIISLLNLLIKYFLNCEDIKFKKIEKEIFYTSNEFNRELFEMKLIDLLNHNFNFQFKTKFENNNEKALKKLEITKKDINANILKYLNYTIIEFYKIFYRDDYKSIIKKEFNYNRKINLKNIYQIIEKKADEEDKEYYLKKVKKKMKELFENYVKYFKSKILFKNKNLFEITINK